MNGKRFLEAYALVKRAVTHVACRGLAPLGLGTAQVALLLELGRTGPATQSTLARATMTDMSAAGRVFATLAAHGWIRRRRGELDRRESYVELTASGKRLLARVERMREGLADQIAARISERDIMDLERLGEKLSPLLEEGEPAPPAPRKGRRRTSG